MSVSNNRGGGLLGRWSAESWGCWVSGLRLGGCSRFLTVRLMLDRSCAGGRERKPTHDRSIHWRRRSGGRDFAVQMNQDIRVQGYRIGFIHKRWSKGGVDRRPAATRDVDACCRIGADSAVGRHPWCRGMTMAWQVMTVPTAIIASPNQRGGWTRFIGLGWTDNMNADIELLSATGVLLVTRANIRVVGSFRTKESIIRN